MTFNDRLKTFYRSRILATTLGFAETGTFTPYDTGTPRTLTASVTVREIQNTQDETREQRETIELFILRDESDDLGGVAQLQFADEYIRDPEFDSNDEPFIYRGEVIEQGKHYYKAVFERYAQSSQGRGRF